MRRYRDSLPFLAAVALAATSFTAGRMGDVSLRNPLAMIVMLGMIGSFVAVLWLAAPSTRREP